MFCTIHFVAQCLLQTTYDVSGNIDTKPERSCHFKSLLRQSKRLKVERVDGEKGGERLA